MTEVPQATAREEAREQAIEVMARALRDELVGRHPEVPVEAGPDEDSAHWTRKAEAALDALLSPRTVPCPDSDCKGGWVAWGSGQPWREEGKDRCNQCINGSVTLGPLAVLVGELEQVGWCWPDNDGRGGQTWPYGIVQLRKKPTLADDMEPVFRLPSSKEPHA